MAAVSPRVVRRVLTGLRRAPGRLLGGDASTGDPGGRRGGGATGELARGGLVAGEVAAAEVTAAEDAHELETVVEVMDGSRVVGTVVVLTSRADHGDFLTEPALIVGIAMEAVTFRVAGRCFHAEDVQRWWWG